MSEVTVNAADTMHHIGQTARQASRQMAKATGAMKNAFLSQLTQLIDANRPSILAANARDMESAREAGRDEAFLDRLALNEARINAMIEGCHDVAKLPDPVGEIERLAPQPSGIEVGRMRVPLGVIGMIYEARPNVTIDAAALAVKSGNAIILRGGSESLQTNIALWELVQTALASVKLPREAVQLITTADRAMVGELIRAKDYVDVLIPRGGKSLIARLMAEATVPMIKHLDGICHTYVDSEADLKMALRVVDNAKTQRYAPCNTTETLLVHKSVAFDFLPEIARIFHDKDLASVANRRQTMGNDKYCTSLHQLIHTILYNGLCTGINTGGCLIQHQYRRVGDGCSGDGQQLTLTLREFRAVSIQHRIISLRKFGNKIMCICKFCSCNDFLVCCIQLSITDIVCHCSGEQMGILQYHSKGSS